MCVSNFFNEKCFCFLKTVFSTQLSIDSNAALFFHQKKRLRQPSSTKKTVFSKEKAPAATFQHQKRIFSQKKTPAATYRHQKHVFSFKKQKRRKKTHAATLQDSKPVFQNRKTKQISLQDRGGRVWTLSPKGKIK